MTDTPLTSSFLALLHLTLTISYATSTVTLKEKIYDLISLCLRLETEITPFEQNPQKGKTHIQVPLAMPAIGLSTPMSQPYSLLLVIYLII